jgi:shikimate kinase
MDWMNKNGFTIYFKADPPYLLENILKEKERRPLVRNINENELLYFIGQKLTEREVFYQQAQLTLDARTLNEETFGDILYSLEK